MLSLIASVGLTETVLHGPSRLAAVPGLKSPRPIISAARAVPARVGLGRRRVGRGMARRQRANLQFETERSIRVACAPIDQRRLDLLPRNSARIAFNIVQNVTPRRRPILPLCRDDGRGEAAMLRAGALRQELPLREELAAALRPPMPQRPRRQDRAAAVHTSAARCSGISRPCGHSR
jgi:hypothetical protein